MDWITQEKIAAIRARYETPKLSVPMPVRHLGSCYIGRGGKKICTCGLLGDLMGLSIEAAKELYPNALCEIADHQREFGLMVPA